MYTYIRGSPHIIVRLFMVSTYEFSASQGVPKERWFSGRIRRYRWNLPTSQEKSFPVSEFGQFAHFFAGGYCLYAGFCEIGDPKITQTLLFSIEKLQVYGGPNFDSVLYMQSFKTIICGDHSTSLSEARYSPHFMFWIQISNRFYSKLG